MTLINAFRAYCVCMLLGIVLLPVNAQAVPSYARQTGMPCAGCHTTPPELTPFGRDFKINGYTLTGMQQIESPGKGTQAGLKISEVPPLSAMLITSFTRTARNQPDTQNNDVALPQELSLFFAGEITPHIGSFLQLTYAQSEDTNGDTTTSFSLDNTDIRYANHATVAGKDTIFGVTLNNSPTVEDPWNTTPVWGYPFISSEIAPTPAAAPLVSDALAQQVAGLGGYTLWNDHLYADLTVYRSAHLLGTGPGGAPNNDSENTIKNVTPYWRLAWEQKVGVEYPRGRHLRAVVGTLSTGYIGQDRQIHGPRTRQPVRAPHGGQHAHAAWHLYPSERESGWFCSGRAVRQRFEYARYPESERHLPPGDIGGVFHRGVQYLG